MPDSRRNPVPSVADDAVDGRQPAGTFFPQLLEQRIPILQELITRRGDTASNRLQLSVDLLPVVLNPVLPPLHGAFAGIVLS